MTASEKEVLYFLVTNLLQSFDIWSKIFFQNFKFTCQEVGVKMKPMYPNVDFEMLALGAQKKRIQNHQNKKLKLILFMILFVFLTYSFF